MARFVPPTRTIIPLQIFAEVMETEPVGFMGGDTSKIVYQDGARDAWQLFAWQDPKRLSRSELARQLKQAEGDIASKLGYPVGPTYITNDDRPYPPYFDSKWRSANGRRFDHRMKTIGLSFIKYIQAGVKKLVLLDTPTTDDDELVYSGLEAATWTGTATITIEVPSTFSEAGNFRVFYEGEDGDEDYEIRPLRSVTVTELDPSTNQVVIELDAWLIFKRILQAAGGTYDVRPPLIDIHTEDSYEDSVDVYYETVDSANQGSAYWDGDLMCACGSGDCSGCVPASQFICLEPSVLKQSVMFVSPATVTESVLARSATWTMNREPDRVAANYYTGPYVTDRKTGQKLPPSDLIRAACYITAANLPAKFCDTHEVMKERFQLYMQDYSFAQQGDTGNIRYVTNDISQNPFGTRYGEVLAWRAVSKRISRGDIKTEVSLIY